jgi:hypothetical protein
MIGPCAPVGVGFSAVPRWLPRFPALPSVPAMPLCWSTCRFFPLVVREDLIQVAREALLRSVLRCKAGALQHHLRDRVRLVRIPRRLHEKGQCPLGHISPQVSE